MSPTVKPGEDDIPKISKRFLLLYGSATGQAQAIAEEIAEKAPNFGLTPELHPLDETGKRFNVDHEKCIVIITSTTGDGDPPGNAEKFMRRIKKRTLPSDHLAHLQYALLGLGDTNYSNFCCCAKDMDSRLLAIGAQQFYPTGFADDGVGLEVVAEPWLEGLYPALQKFLSVTENSGTSLTEAVEALSLNGPCSSPENIQSAQTTQTNLTDTTKTNSADTTKTNSADTAIDNISSVINSLSDSETVLGSVDVTDALRTNGDLDNLTQTQLVEQATYFDSQRLLETPCALSILEEEDVTLCPLVSSDSQLAEASLTVPVLPPEFLQAKFSSAPVKLTEMSHQNGLKLPLAASDVMNVKISSAKVLTHADAVKKTLLLSLNLQGCGVEYRPGDSISVMCPNNCSEVDMLIERLSVSGKANDLMTLSVIPDTKKRRSAVPPHIHETSTLRHTLMTCVNIREPPSKAFIRALVEFTSNPKEARRLQELCSKQGGITYTSVVREKNVSILDFLLSFPSCKPPVERVLEFLPRLQPRPYSACSCPLVDKDRLDIVFNVVDISANITDGNMYDRRGLCTGWLDDITQSLQDKEVEESMISIEIPVFLRTNQHFRPPDDLSRPVIMIGPGTGVAPFIGFLEERRCQRQKIPEGSAYGDTWLFYGCRHKNKDFLFRDELLQFESEGVLSHLCVACSRDEPVPGSIELTPRYVQDFLRLMSQTIAMLVVEEEALVYVCGDAHGMAKDVNLAFEEILQKEKDMSKEAANTYMMMKRLHKTYFEDVWT